MIEGVDVYAVVNSLALVATMIGGLAWLRKKTQAETQEILARTAYQQTLTEQLKESQKAIKKGQSEIHEQVKNTHVTNLRQDIDKSNRTTENILHTLSLQAEAYASDKKETQEWRTHILSGMHEIEGRLAKIEQIR